MQRIEIPAGVAYHHHLKAGGTQAVTSQRVREVDAELRADGRWHFTSAGVHYSISKDAVRVVGQPS